MITLIQRNQCRDALKKCKNNTSSATLRPSVFHSIVLWLLLCLTHPHRISLAGGRYLDADVWGFCFLHSVPSLHSAPSVLPAFYCFLLPLPKFVQKRVSSQLKCSPAEKMQTRFQLSFIFLFHFWSFSGKRYCVSFHLIRIKQNLCVLY